MLQAPERVLPTLNHDGSRRLIRPRLFKGRFQRRRFVTAWGLMALFTALPFVRLRGRPAILLDVVHREFTLFGRTFLPTDGVLLMLLLLTIFLTVILLTALVGRAWCGWGCPQTVYMEFLFRPIERLIEGDHLAQAKLDRNGPNARRFLKMGVFLLVSVVVGNIFLSYFVGVDALSRWMREPPSEHLSAFLVMGVTTSLVFFDFAIFREQMCTVICPYARLQSVLLDKKSLVVAYDVSRGEPRGKKGTTAADCVDCGVCVVACPTGIDIREGLQLECIACTQCIDGCDGVMDKLKRPRGLIRYTTQDALERKRFDLRSLVRPRILVYPVMIAVLVTVLFVAASSRTVADVTILRGTGAPFVEQGQRIRNIVRLKIRNRTRETQAYALSVLDAPEAELVAPENPLHVAPGEQTTESLFVLVPRTSFASGVRTVRLRASLDSGFERIMTYQLLGPEGP